MEEGFLFYWFSWILWIIVTFLMKKGRIRTLLAYWILLSIIGSAFTVKIGFYFSSITVMLLLLGSVLLLAKNMRIIHYLFLSFTVMIGYTALLFWEKISPIWIIAPRVLLVSIILCCFVSIISKQIYSRIGICLFGMLGGEIIFSIILASYGLQEEIGEMLFLDTLASTLLLLIIIDILHKGKTKISAYNTKLQTKLEVAK